MDEKRAKTLEALSIFIESQQALLSRTQSDIERLKELRDDMARTSEMSPTALSQQAHQLDQGIFRLNAQSDLAINIVEEVDWSLYKGQDPSPFRSLASSLRHARSHRDKPRPFQSSELSDLQKFVKKCRQSIVDPVLTRLSSDPQYIILSDDDEPLDPREIKRELEREKIRQLKKRKINCTLTIPIHASSRRVLEGGEVFIRRDQDESADVDVIMDEALDEAMAVDPPVCSVVSPVSAPAARREPLRRPDQEQRSLRKVERRKIDAPVKPGKELKAGGHNDQNEISKPTRVRGPKSDTYKLAWSVEEQHLLERLLEEIPDGEKNRWAKISQAMNGRRTARQVASRVQKYFEKLKKFGVEIE